MATFTILPTSGELVNFSQLVGSGTLTLEDDNGTPVLQYVTSDAQSFVRYDPVTSAEDVEILVKMRVATGSANIQRNTVAVRLTEDNGSAFFLAAGPRTDGQTIFVRNQNTGGQQNREDSGVLSALPTTAYCIRLGFNGSTSRYSAWTGGPGDEPLDGQGDPDWVRSDNLGSPPSGSIGIGTFAGVGTTTMLIEAIGVATEGETAFIEEDSPLGINIENILGPNQQPVGTVANVTALVWYSDDPPKGSEADDVFTDQDITDSTFTLELDDEDVDDEDDITVDLEYTSGGEKFVVRGVATVGELNGD